ncbi:MAG: penicillin-insensitive murein endopeptidase [Sandaracinaceae bacterium]
MKARPRFALVGVLLVLGAWAPASAWPAAADGGSDHDGRMGWVYVVERGDTLSEIATRIGVTLEDLCAWNADLDPHRIRPGQHLRILDGRRRIDHVVKAGETLSEIAVHWDVSLEEMLRWNEGLTAHRILRGQRLRVYTPVPASPSQSVGTPQGGRLVDGRQLPSPLPAFEVRNPARAWGTDETVRAIVRGYERVRRAFPGTPKVEIHDLSRRRGGRLGGHRSLRSGRDADISYYQRACPDAVCPFARIGPEELDAARQWSLFQGWIRAGEVDAIFMDHSLQEPLYREARRRGLSREERDLIFQYPRPPWERVGLIRHHRSHADHFHVRFVCHASDPDCR